MHKSIIHCGWDLIINETFSKQIEIFVDFYGINNAPLNNGNVKVLLLCEPEEIVRSSKMAINNKHYFDYILTHNQDVLDQCENAILFEFGGCWVKDYEFPEKNFEVSTLVGGKTMAAGHYIRHQIWNRQNEIIVPKKFFLSGNFNYKTNVESNSPILGDSKNPLFDSQFHIVIENINRQNWFTEKIIDCLQTKTIPIYWGCPNIGEWFNIDGFLIANSVEEIIEKTNSITPELYESKKDIIEENYEKSKFYTNINTRLENKLKEIII